MNLEEQPKRETLRLLSSLAFLTSNTVIVIVIVIFFYACFSRHFSIARSCQPYLCPRSHRPIRRCYPHARKASPIVLLTPPTSSRGGLETP